MTARVPFIARVPETTMVPGTAMIPDTAIDLTLTELEFWTHHEFLLVLLLQYSSVVVFSKCLGDNNCIEPYSSATPCTTLHCATLHYTTLH